MPSVFIEEIGRSVQFPDDMSRDDISRVIEGEILPKLRQETTPNITDFSEPVLSRDEQIDKRQEDRSFLDSFTTGFKRSLVGSKNILLEGGIRSLAEKTIGRDDEAENYAEKYRVASQEMEQTIPATIPTYKDIKNVADFADYSLGATGYFASEIGQIGASALTGGGILPAIATSGAKLIGKKGLKASTKQNLKTKGAKIGGFGLIGSKNFSETYHTFLEETEDPNLAMVYTVGAVNTALDAIVPMSILKKLGGEGREKLSQHIATRVAKGFASGAVREGGTEAIQTLNNEFFDNFNLTSEEIEQIIDSGIFGALGGGNVSAVTSGISSPKNDEKSTIPEDDIELREALTDVNKGGGLSVSENPVLLLPSPKTTGDIVREDQALRNETEDQIFDRLNSAESSFFDSWEGGLISADGTEIIGAKKKKGSFKKKLGAGPYVWSEDKGEEKQAQSDIESGQKEYRQTDNYKSGVEFVEKRLQALKDKGQQGEKTALGIREILNDRDISVGNALAAFRMGDIVNEILPQSADYTITFADVLSRKIDGNEQNIQGVVNAGAKTMALSLDMTKSFNNIRSAREAIQYQQETASHEAFHVLQEFFSQQDKGSSELLARTFGQLNEKVDYSNSSVKSWIRRTNQEMHRELERMNQTQRGIKGSELQAYAFSVYDTARRNGKAPVMAGGLSRYFRFISQFLERLSNSLRGSGFRSAQDVFDMASKGAFATTFDGQGLATSSILEDSDEDHSARPTRFLDKAMKKIYTPNSDSNNLVKGPNGSTSLAKIIIEKGQKKQTVGLPMGADYFNSDTELRGGFGARHIVSGHLRHIQDYTPHEKVVPFIQDVLINGKVNKVAGDSNKITVTHKGIGFKFPALVALRKDADRNIWTVTSAYPIVGGKVFGKQEDAMLKKQEQLSARKGFRDYPFAPVPQKTIDNNGSEDRIRRSVERRKSYISGVSNAPKNKSTEIVLDGKPVWYVGQKTYEQWLTGVEANLTSEQISESLRWYSDAKPIFQKYFGQNWTLYLASWLMANQQASPSEAMKNMLKSLERVKNGIPVDGLNPASYIENKKKYAKDGLPADTKAGLPAERLNEFWKYHFLGGNNNSKAPVGGQKLYDFVDAGIGKKTRSWMGDKDEGGQPAVADVHSLRGVGMYDQVVKTRLEKLLGKNAVQKLNLEIDTTGSPSEPTYEKSADFLRDVTDYLNSTGKFREFNDGQPLTAEQTQAVDWMTVISFLGNAGETPINAIQKNIWGLNYELAFGTNTPYSKKYSSFFQLPTYEQKNITQLMLEDATTFARNISGAREHLRTHATGGWLENGSNPNTKSDLIASEDAVTNTAAIIGYIAEQDAMFSYRFSGKTGKSKIGLIIRPEKSNSKTILNNAPMMDSLWQALQAEPVLKKEFAGFATETIDDNSAMFISLDSKSNSVKGKKIEESIKNGEIKKALDKVSMETGFDIKGETVYHEANLLENDYNSEKGKNGGIYLQRIARSLGDETAKRVEDYKRNQFEPRLDALLREGFKNEGSKQARDPSEEAKRLRYEDQFSARSGQPNLEIKKVAESYVREARLNPEGLTSSTWNFVDSDVVDDINQIKNYLINIGNHQEHAIHRPLDDYVLETYKPFMKELQDQYQYIKNVQKLEILPWREEGQPYKDSASMMEDIAKNNRFYFYMTDTGFGEFGTGDLVHPLLEMSSETNSLGEQMLYNDVFRVVHDYFGHAQKGFSFSALGEYNAFREHLVMFSPEARQALATESLFQNAWLLYGPHIKQDGQFPEVGDPNYIPIKDREFSEQKVHRPPLELLRQDSTPDIFPQPKTIYENRLDQYSARQANEPFANVIIQKNENSLFEWLGSFGRIDWKSFGRKIESDIFDSVSPIADLERATNYAKTGQWELNDAQNSPYKKIMMAKNTAGRAETVLMNGAPIIDNDGFLSIDEDSPSLVSIYNRLTSAKEALDYSKYAIARRARELTALGKENLVTPEEIEIGLGLENEKFQGMFEDYQVYNKKLLNFLRTSGVISEKEQENFSRYDYVPFYREMREDRYDKKTGIEMKDTLGPRISRVLNNPNPYIEKYTGGKLPIGDIMDNTVRNTQAFLRAAVNNHAMQESVKLFKEAGIGKEIKENQRGKDTYYVTYRDLGQKKYYDVENPLLYTALASMSPQQTRGLFKIMESVGKVFRDFITHQPAFMVANLIRGEVSGLVSVDAPVTPILDSIKGFKATLQNDEVIREMKLNAGVGGFSFGDDVSDVGKKIRRDRRLRNKDYKILDTPLAVSDAISKLWGGLTKTGEASELAFRHAVYTKLINSTNPRTGLFYTKQEAAYQALNVINFNRKGALSSSVGQMLGTLIPLVPFLNARLQGLYRTLDPLVTGRQASRQRFIRNGVLLGAASLLLYDFASDDERYDREALFRRLNYHIFYIGEDRYSIPRAFEVGAIFTTLPEFVLDSFRKENGDEAWKALKMTLLNTFSFNPIPQAIKPLIEVGVNYDFFKDQPIDNYAQMNYLPAQRTGPNTPQVSQSISQFGQDMLGTSLSPNQISKLVVGYLGSMGTMALTAFDVSMANSGLAPSRATGAYGDSILGKMVEISGFGRFKSDGLDASNQYITNFYEVKKEVDQIHNTISRLIKDGKVEKAQEIFQENKKLLVYRTGMNKFYSAFKDINAVIRSVKLNTELKPEEKRSRLLALNNQKNKISTQFNKVYQQIKKDM